MKNDPFGFGKATLDLWNAMASQPWAIAQTQAAFAASWLEMLAPKEGAANGAAAANEDRRFAHVAWTENPAFAALKNAYLAATQAMLQAIDDAPDLDPKTRRRAKFFTKQLCDALSPTNFPWLNPQVLEETMRSGGANLNRGVQNLMDDLRENEGRVALVDRKAFDVGRNIALSPGKVVYRNELVELIQYTPTTELVYERPLVIVPPWINKFYVLDLQPANSFIAYAVAQGFSTFVLSWRNPDASMADVTMEDYLRLGPQACSQAAAAITRSPDVNVVGYCIGGTLVAMFLAYLKKKGEPLVNAATFFASLIDFSDPGEVETFLGSDALEFIEEKMQERGYLDGREMGDTFTMLRANDLIWSVAVNRYLLGKDAPAFDLLYWNSDSTRMPRAMHSYYLRQMYVANNLVKPDALSVDGVPIDLRRVDNDVYAVATLEDHIAPWKSVYAITQLFRGDVRFRLGHSGHIAGIVNPPGKAKGNWWSADANPPAADAWFAAATKHEGSWWPDWAAWLAERSGKQKKARLPGKTKAYPALADAPGEYVKQT